MPGLDLLIVEDEAPLLASLIDGIRAARPELEVVGAGSVELANEVIEALDAPRLLVSDIRLPGSSGLEFILDAHLRFPGSEFILMSAYESPLMQVESAERLIRFLRKPFDLDELVAEIDRALQEGFRGERSAKNGARA